MFRDITFQAKIAPIGEAHNRCPLTCNLRRTTPFVELREKKNEPFALSHEMVICTELARAVRHDAADNYTYSLLRRLRGAVRLRSRSARALHQPPRPRGCGRLTRLMNPAPSSFLAATRRFCSV